MSDLTISEIPPGTFRLLERAAAQEKKSVDQFVLELILEKIGFNTKADQVTSAPETDEFSELDALFGTWSEEEYQQIQGRIDEGRVIDRELWNKQEC